VGGVENRRIVHQEIGAIEDVEAQTAWFWRSSSFPAVLVQLLKMARRGRLEPAVTSLSGGGLSGMGVRKVPGAGRRAAGQRRRRPARHRSLADPGQAANPQFRFHGAAALGKTECQASRP